MSGPEVGSAALREFLLNALKTERGVHLESLLACLGSVGGFSCHMAARAAMNQGELATEGGLMEVVSADGRTITSVMPSTSCWWSHRSPSGTLFVAQPMRPVGNLLMWMR